MQTPLHIVHLIECNRRQQTPILDLRSRALLAVPPEIRELTHLQQLLLKDNAIQVLPDWLNDLPELRFIELNINPLRELGTVHNLVLDWGVWQRLEPVPAQVAGLWLRWEEDYELLEQVRDLPDLRWLDLSAQRLQEIPKWVWSLERLQALILSRNELSKLSSAIAQLRNLTQVDLSGNQLRDLPPAIGQLCNLTQLNLSGNQLHDLIPAIAQLVSLTQLDLNHNRFSELPLAIVRLENLTQLDLSYNGVSELPPAIKQLCNLTQINLKNNVFKEVPLVITQLCHLTHLDLSYNRFSKLPLAIEQLSNLIRLDLSDNRFSELPPAIVRLKNLTQLNLSGNQLRQLLPAIGQLSNLTQLDLSRNQLSDLPSAIAQLDNLTQLDLSNNYFKELPLTILELDSLTQLDLGYNRFNELQPVIAQLSNLTQLDISGNQLRELSPAIMELSNLTQLDLSDNSFGELPPAVAHLSHLSQLVLSHNQLRELPSDIAQLNNLAQLVLSRNQFRELPPVITQLCNLTQLDISGNQLNNLPPVITQMDNLTQLHLSSNGLRELPSTIAQLTNLTQLNLSVNQLRDLPLAIAQLCNLSQLNVSSNKLSKLPAAIAQPDDLRTLKLEDNELEISSLEVFDVDDVWGEADVTKLRAFFEQAVEIDHIYEAKLILLGESGAGKTSLARRIRDSDSLMPEEEQFTHGIDIESWIFTCADGKPFRVNIWDFGAQQIYHATHQFFLTKCSLYALLVDTRKEKTQFHDWLSRIELFSEKSPVFIVKNQKDDCKIELDLAHLRNRFENLEQIFDCNIKTNEGREALLNFIRYRVQELPHIGKSLPKSWLAIRELLETDERNYLEINEYFSICQQNGFKRRRDALQLSEYLHDIGIFLHFKDDDLLRKTIILKPTWATDAVYKVLNAVEVQKQYGYFRKEDLELIWCDDSYADMRPELLRLTMNFYLCYELPEKNQYIAPQLLSKQKPTYQWNSDNNLQLRYQYPGFMPSGLLIRFIVAIHPMIEEQRRRVWRYGVVLTDGKARAEVREDIEHREIRLRFSGNQQHDLLATLMHELEKIHAPFKKSGLEYYQMVPCNCERCINHPEPYFYAYQTLKEFQTEQIPEIQCYKSHKMVNVLQLIEGVESYQKPIVKFDESLAFLNLPELDEILPEKKHDGSLKTGFFSFFKRFFRLS